MHAADLVRCALRGASCAQAVDKRATEVLNELIEQRRAETGNNNEAVVMEWHAPGSCRG